MRRLLIALAMAGSAVAQDQVCHGHTDYGLPSQVDQVLCYEGFVLGYNYRTKVSDWAMYRVTDDIARPINRYSSGFRQEHSITDRQHRSTNSDYTHSGYDRGHLAPRALLDQTMTLSRETYTYANAAPQLPAFNREGWAELEEAIRDCVSLNDDAEMIIVTGPIYLNDVEVIGDGVHIADYFFKAAIETKPPHRSFAFMVPHRPLEQDGTVFDFTASIALIEEMTELELFAAAPLEPIDDQELCVEYF